jgi:hypothetical protein
MIDLKETQQMIDLLKHSILVQEKAMKMGLSRADVMPEYIADLEELDRLEKLIKDERSE